MTKLINPLSVSTPQNQPLRGRESEMIKNRAGGYVFKVSDLEQANRFIILGSPSNFYAGKKEMTLENAEAICRLVSDPENGKLLVDMLVMVSDGGFAPNNEPAIFALAIACSTKFAHESVRAYALANLGKVCRIPTHWMQFFEFATGGDDPMRGWGRAFCNAAGKLYTSRNLESLVTMVTKYQNREGWTNADVLRLAHPKPLSQEMKTIFKWITTNAKGNSDPGDNVYLQAFEQLKKEKDIKKAIALIQENNFQREHVPTELLNSKEVWKVLLPNLGITALLRNLAKLTSIGMFDGWSDQTQIVCDRLTDIEQYIKGRVHPIQILKALKVYQSGHGEKGSLTWNPEPQIVDALEKGIELSFRAKKALGKKILIGVDVSGSMSSGTLNDISIAPFQGAFIQALTFLKSDPTNTKVVEFDSGGILDRAPANRSNSHGVWLSTLKSSDSYHSAMNRNCPGGSTDLSLPIQYALAKNLFVDSFIIFTDNETWSGQRHASDVLEEYKKKINKDVKLVVASMTSTGYGIVDPKDNSQLNIVGFSLDVPQVIEAFVANQF